jgi:hypothetical protein
VAISVESRRERGEQYDAIHGLFNEYELIYIWGTEADLTGRRAVLEKNQLYMYPLLGSMDSARKLFLDLAEVSQQLETQPRFYNTLTSNCTTIVFELARRLSPALPLDYRLLLSGYFADYVFDHGVLTPGYSFAQLRQAGRITELALEGSAQDDYSRLIRQGVPGVTPQELGQDPLQP